MKNQLKVKRIIIYTGLFLLLYIIETLPQSSINFGSSAPELLIPFAVVLAMWEGEKAGAVAGFAAGLLYDAQGGGLTGFYTILLMFFGYYTGLLMTFLLRRNVLTSLALCLSWVLAVNYLFYLFFYYLYGVTDIAYISVKIILPRVIVSLFCVVLFYFLVRHIFIRFHESEVDSK